MEFVSQSARQMAVMILTADVIKIVPNFYRKMILAMKNAILENVIMMIINVEIVVLDVFKRIMGNAYLNV